MDKHKEKIIIFTGAGISADSGIPTFEETDGIRDKLTRDYALTHTEDYIKTIREMKETCEKAEPNIAHKAIATLDCTIITMNIDGLHERAGSKNVLNIHGRLPNNDEIEKDNFRFMLNRPVLYGDPAPNYEIAYRLVKSLDYGKSYFIVIGTSFYTNISEDLLKIAKQKKAKVIIINDNASERVPKLIEMLNKQM